MRCSPVPLCPSVLSVLLPLAGVMDVKSSACELLLAQRVEQKMSGSKIEQVVNRIRVAQPKPRGDVKLVRNTSIPLSVTAAKAAKAAAAEIAAEQRAKNAGAGGSSTDLPEADHTTKRRTARDAQEEQGGAGVYSMPLQTHWQLKTPEWVNDIIPEIMDGKNILDFVDPDIEARLAELEEEEEQRAQLAEMQGEVDSDEDMDDERKEAQAGVAKLAKAIRKKKGIIKEKARMAKNNNHPTMSRAVAARNRSVSEFVEHMGGMGVRTDAASLPNLAAHAKKQGGLAGDLPARERRRDKSADAPSRREGRSLTREDDARSDSMDIEGGKKRSQKATQVPRDRSSTARDQASASRGRSRSPSASGLKDEEALAKALKMTKKQQHRLNKFGRASESDRRVPDMKPKHLNTGKRGIGKSDRR